MKLYELTKKQFLNKLKDSKRAALLGVLANIRSKIKDSGYKMMNARLTGTAPAFRIIFTVPIKDEEYKTKYEVIMDRLRVITKDAAPTSARVKLGLATPDRILITVLFE